MKPIDFSLNTNQVLTLKDKKVTRKGYSPYTLFVLFVTAVLVLALFVSAATASPWAPGGKQKFGKSGQCYDWKKDC